MYKALYRTERPETFDEVIGQEHIVRVLKNQIANNTVGHAYLFCGTRGTGKTTMARLLAKAVNCTSDGERPCGCCDNCLSIKDGSFIDMIEIDAASNNGVESVREIRDSVNYPASIGRRKVYIIDEVHMLSTAAFNALLKTLEEPPEGIMFILATTDPQKLPQTILSRCMRFNFRRVSETQLAGQMKAICEKRGVKITDSALKLLAANADGSVRDGLSLLDQCLAGTDKVLDRETVLEFLGTVSEGFFLELTEKVCVRDTSGALLLLDEVLAEGKDVKQLLNDWMAHYRSLLIAKYIKDAENLLNMSGENIEKLKEQSQEMDLATINSSILTLANTINDARYSTQPRTLMELAIVVLANGIRDGGAAPATFVESTASVPMTKSGRQVKDRAAAQEIRQAARESKTENPEPVASQSEPVQDVASGNAGASYDMDELWERVWDRLPEHGSISMVRMNTSLAGVNEREFKVIACSDFVRDLAEKNTEIITKAVADEVGRPLKMVLRSASDAVDLEEASVKSTDSSNDEEAKKIAEALESSFNIKPRIE
ncbi:DNA polymerase III subunit tau [[Eubacterium] infirmum]|nr:DNA polymerase III subunit tau [[Eubacterium] infirmum]